MSFETANIGIIGAVGKHTGQSYTEQMALDPQCHLGVLADTNLDGLRAVGQQYAPDAELTTHWQEVVAHPDLDAVLIMTPDDQHIEQMLAVIKNNKHVLVEKPLANDWPSLEHLRSGLALAREKGLVVSSCFARHFDPPYINTKTLLDNSAALAAMFELSPTTDFGPVTHFKLGHSYSRPSKSGPHGNFASYHLPYEIDTASYLFGLSGLKIAMSTVMEEPEFIVQACREDNIILHFEGEGLQDKNGYREDFQIDFASQTCLSVNAYTGRVQLTHRGESYSTAPEDNNGQSLFKTDHKQRFKALNSHFIRSILGKDKAPPYLSDREMLMSTVAALALQEVYTPVAITADSYVTRVF